MASAGASFHVAISSGKFQGTTAPMTPRGTRRTIARSPAPVGAISSYSLSIASACHWKKCADPGASMVDESRIGLPMSSVSRSASSATFSRINAASRSSTSLRAAGARRDQRPSSNARRADATARSISTDPPRATSASTAPVAGLTVGNRDPSALGTKRPSIQQSVRRRSAAARAFQSSWLSIIHSPGIFDHGRLGSVLGASHRSRFWRPKDRPLVRCGPRSHADRHRACRLAPRVARQR